MWRSVPNPLIDIALATISEILYTIKPEVLANYRSLLDGMLQGRIKYQEAVQTSMQLIGNTQAVDKIEEILRVPDTPIQLNHAFYMNSGVNSERSKTRSWNSYEDKRLLAAINKFGLDSWPMVAAFVGNGRTKAQCSQRWIRGLDPRIEKAQWTEEQDEKLLKFVAMCGDKSWTKIAGMMQNRCDVQCRYRYKQLQKDENFADKMAAAQQKLNSTGNAAGEPTADSVESPNKVNQKRYENTGQDKASRKKRTKKQSQAPQIPVPQYPMQFSNTQADVSMAMARQMMHGYPPQNAMPMIQPNTTYMQMPQGQMMPPKMPMAPPMVMMPPPHQMQQQMMNNPQIQPQVIQQNQQQPTISYQPSNGQITEQTSIGLLRAQDSFGTIGHFEETGNISGSSSFFAWPGQLQPSNSGTGSFGIQANDSFVF